jgi:sugar-specific transcriptional regulator TrmB
MIIKPELVKKIKDYFNLNIYETKVWLALLSKGIASAGEIAELGGVPRSRAYDVMESLEKKGFAIVKVGKPTNYIAVKPLAVLEKLKIRTRKRAEEKIEILDKLKRTREYGELEELYKTSLKPIRREELSGAIKGRSAIYGHAREILGNADKEVLVCMPASELLEKARVFRNIFDKLKQENITVKLALNGKEDELENVHRKYDIKPQKSKTNSKFFIVDRKQILFNLTNSPSDEEELAIWLNSEFFSEAFANLFEDSLRK